MWRSVLAVVLVAVLAVGAGAATVITKQPGVAPRHTEVQARLSEQAGMARPHGARDAGTVAAADGTGRAHRPPAVPPDAGEIFWLMRDIDYGTQMTSPICYGNTRPVCRQAVADVPWTGWETGDTWDNEVLYSYWDDLFWTFTTPESLTSSGDDAGRISVVSDPQGTVHAVWHQSDDYDLDPHETYYAQRPVGGNWSDPVQLSPEDLKNSVFPVVDVDGLGMVWVAWMDRTETPSILHGLYATYSTDGGLTWDPSALHRISDVDTTIDIPVIAADPNNGEVWVAYEEAEWDPSDIFNDVVIYHYTPGTGWDGGTVVAYSDTTLGEPGSKPNMEPTLVVDGNSVCHMIFQANAYDQNQAGYGSYDPNCYMWVGMPHHTCNAGGTWSYPEALWPIGLTFPDDYTSTWMGIGVVGADEEGNLYCASTAYYLVTPSEQQRAYLYGQKEAVIAKRAVGETDWHWRIASFINDRGDSTYVKYAKIAQEVPMDGPDVIWDEALEGGDYPYDVLFSHLDTDFTPPGPVTDLMAAVVPTGVKLAWRNPTDADWEGTELYRSGEDFPFLAGFGVLFPEDAEDIYYGTDTEYVDTDVTTGETYYYGAAPWDVSGMFTAAATCSITVGDPDTVPPAAVTEFTADYVGDPGVLGAVALDWTNPADADWWGTMIRRSDVDYPATPMDGDLIYDGYGDSFVDSLIDQNMDYYYAAFAYDVAGNYAEAAQDTATVPLGADDGQFAPSASLLRLEAPTPNPSSSTVDIRLHVAAGASVDVSAYDASGRLVATIMRDRVTAGTHVAAWDVGQLPAGVYVVRATAAGSSASRKVAVVQ